MKIGTSDYTIELSSIAQTDGHSLNTQNSYDWDHRIKSEYALSSQIRIVVFNETNSNTTAIIGAEGGATAVHENSQVIIENRLYICCGDSIFCLEIPSLELNWQRKVDEVTAFGIYQVDSALIIHGELNISKLATSGEVLWQNSGKDIFVTDNGSSSFELQKDHLIVNDWSDNIYKWDFEGREIV